jgi:hypothetical protein
MQAREPKAFWIPPNLQPRESEIVDAVFQSEKPIRGEPVESCKLRYFNSFRFSRLVRQLRGLSLQPCTVELILRVSSLA